MAKWLEFRVEKTCKHEADLYDGCPLCRIAELEAERDENILNLLDRIEELEAQLRIQEEQSFGLLRPLQTKLKLVEREIEYAGYITKEYFHTLMESVLGDENA